MKQEIKLYIMAPLSRNMYMNLEGQAEDNDGMLTEQVASLVTGL